MENTRSKLIERLTGEDLRAFAIIAVGSICAIGGASLLALAMLANSAPAAGLGIVMVAFGSAGLYVQARGE